MQYFKFLRKEHVPSRISLCEPYQHSPPQCATRANSEYIANTVNLAVSADTY